MNDSELTISASHLEEIGRALENLRGLSTTLDLQSQYRSLKTSTIGKSALTKQADRALALVTEYLSNLEDDHDIPVG
jgi:hypothetical protein